MYSKGGTLLTSTEEVIKQWKEHFEELLNQTNPPSTIEAGFMLNRKKNLFMLHTITLFKKQEGS